MNDPNIENFKLRLELAAVKSKLAEVVSIARKGRYSGMDFVAIGKRLDAMDDYLDEKEEPKATAAIPDSSESAGGVCNCDYWMPIESAPITNREYFFARIAWGPDEDKSTGDGVFYNMEWYAAAVFYRNGQDRKFGFREHRVVPTHWKPRSCICLSETAVENEVCHK